MINVTDAIDQIYQENNLIGQQVDQSDVLLYLSRAINYFSTTYALPTAKRTTSLLMFNGVREYALPSDFGTLIEPKRPPALTSPRFIRNTERELSHWPYGRKLAVEWDGATPFLAATNDQDSASSLIHGCDDVDGVTLSGDGSLLGLDEMIYTEGTGSIKFTVTGATGQTVLTFVIDPIDVTDALTQNWSFLDLICPSTNTVDLTDVKLRLGTDASNYYEMTATARYRGQDLEAGSGLIGFDFTAATETGAVTDTNIVWMQVIIDHGTSGVNGVYHLDNIFTSRGVYFDIPYYSQNNVLDATGARTTTVADGYTILFPTGFDEALIYKTLELIAASPNIKDSSFANYAARELKPKEDALAALYPVERILVQSQWYKK
jgi:hypothetical protein